MEHFLSLWHQSARTTLGFFWMAFWAFAFGYLISSLIQVLITRTKMQRTMGQDGPRSIFLGSLFGFLSSSCSFAALSTTRAIFQKGAGLAPSIAFLLASTNLVIELGFVIAIFLSWHFILGEYLGGVLLILYAWCYVRLTRPDTLIEKARKKLKESKDHTEEEKEHSGSWMTRLRNPETWHSISMKYWMEWGMVWKDVLIGFTVAGAIAAFVPDSFFQALFIGSGSEGQSLSFFHVLEHTLVGPVAAFFTFIGSMGNVPLAGILYAHGVSFAGVMAFLFSDLVVLPVLRINAQYYGWKMSLYILGLLLSGLIVVSLLLHFGLDAFHLLPHVSLAQGAEKLTSENREFFKVDYGFYLNVIFILMSATFWWISRFWREDSSHKHHQHSNTSNGSSSIGTKMFHGIVTLCAIWVSFGSLVGIFIT